MTLVGMKTKKAAEAQYQEQIRLGERAGLSSGGAARTQANTVEGQCPPPWMMV